MKPLTPEQQEDVNNRVKDFQDKLAQLQKDLQVEIVGVPTYVPTQTGFSTICQVMMADTKFLSVKSPLSDSIIKEA